jgi:Cu/Ag efflux pump CusA
LTWIVAFLALGCAAVLFHFVGGEFMPALEEGNLWIRADMQQDISFQASAKMADDIRATLRAYPEVTQVVSQMGRPDDGTDVSTFNNIEFLADLKPRSVASAVPWQQGRLIAAISHSFRAISRRRLQFLAKHSGQRRRSDVRRQGRKLTQALRQRLRSSRGSPDQISGNHAEGSRHH